MFNLGLIIGAFNPFHIGHKELLEKGLITYVDNSEINNAVVAFTPKELTKYHNDYCEIPDFGKRRADID